MRWYLPPPVSQTVRLLVRNGSVGRPVLAARPVLARPAEDTTMEEEDDEDESEEEDEEGGSEEEGHGAAAEGKR